MKTALVLKLLFAPSVVFSLLDAKFKAKGKLYFGTALDSNALNNVTSTIITRSEIGAFTPQNSANWDVIEPSRGSFNFGSLDTLVNYAATNGKLVRGHTLVWHSQLPTWVKNISNATVLTSAVTNHIKTIVARYKGKIIHWDVVNEPLDSSGGLRNSIFNTILGESFIDLAFQAAREADPSAKLYINEYGLDGPGTKLTGMVNLISRLKSRGVPIDGVGTQAHLLLGQVDGVPSSLETLAATGLDVAITELEIQIPSPATSDKLAQQQTDYNTVTKACIAVSKCVGITTWGVCDGSSSFNDTIPNYGAPLLWNYSCARKPAYTGVDAAVS